MEGGPYKFFTTSGAVVRNMNDSIQQVGSILKLGPQQMKTLLNSYGWDTQRLLDAYFDRNPEGASDDSQSPLRSPLHHKMEECEICLSKPSSEMYELTCCGHSFCIDCLSSHMTTKINEGIGDGITCPAYDCSNIVEHEVVMKLVGDSEVKDRYELLIANSFVEANRRMRWCPSPKCGTAIHVDFLEDSEAVTCKCGFKFCFDCGEASHYPVKCSWLKEWLEKYERKKTLIQREETEAFAIAEQEGELKHRLRGNGLPYSESYKWLLDQRKECPECHTPTGRTTSRSNFVFCNNQDCNFQFCWYCLTSWAEHRKGDGCHHVVAASSSKVQDEDEERYLTFHSSKGQDEDDERYLTFHNRYEIHNECLKREKTLWEVMEGKLTRRELYIPGTTAEQFHKALDVLCECRRTLVYSCVVSFNLGSSYQSEIFEVNLADFESLTEAFATSLERGLCWRVFDPKVNDLSYRCQLRRKALLDHVQEGYDQGWWSDGTGEEGNGTRKKEIGTEEEENETGEEENWTRKKEIGTEEEENETGEDENWTGKEENVTGNEENWTGKEENVTGNEENGTGEEEDGTEEVTVTPGPNRLHGNEN